MIFIEPGSLVYVDRNEMWHGETPIASKRNADSDVALLLVLLAMCLAAAAVEGLRRWGGAPLGFGVSGPGFRVEGSRYRFGV